MRAQPLRVFFWVDSIGLPLEVVIDAYRRKLGWSVDQVCALFHVEAARAGWRPAKIASEERDGRFLAS